MDYGRNVVSAGRVVLKCTAAVRVFAVIGVIAGALDGRVLAGEAPIRSDDVALSKIMGEQHLGSSGAWVIERANAMEPIDAEAFLRKWVMPGATHPGFRVTTDFVSVSSPLQPSRIFELEDSIDRAPLGKMVSPAIELVRRAMSVRSLESLKSDVLDFSPESPQARCDQLAMQFLIAVAQHENSVAKALLDDLLQLVVTDSTLLDDVRQPVLLCLEVGSHVSELDALVSEAQAIVKEVYRKVSRHDAWHRHLWAVSTDGLKDTITHSEQWIPATQARAFEFGNGYPRSRWEIEAGNVRRQASLGDDFLYFVSPLRGTFDVEAHAMGFGYHDTHLLVGGRWTGLGSNHSQVIIGNIRGEFRRQPVEKKLSDTDRHGFIRTRVVAKNGVVRTDLLGHVGSEFDSGPNGSPWVAIRNMRRTYGGVDDLSVTGRAEVPDSIEMIGTPGLTAWYDFFHEPNRSGSRLGKWTSRFETSTQGDRITELNSPRDDDLVAGIAAERLLVYGRPAIEDGVIEYEYWYEPGAVDAAPVIGKQALMISPSGVGVHHVTDGRFERSQLRPDNLTSLSSDVRPALREAAWNAVRISLHGDELALSVNGMQVQNLALSMPTVDRYFGLFHYADLTSLRVRNLRWSGDWPKSVPERKDQELVDPVHHFLAESSADFQDHTHLTLNANSFENGDVVVLEGGSVEDVTPQADGIVLKREGTPGYHGVTLGPNVRTVGDFDVTLRFADFAGQSAEGKISNVRLIAVSSGDEETRAGLQRITTRDGNQNVQCMKLVKRRDGEQRHYFGHQPSECSAGRLRLSRRGDQIYYQIADNDSSVFRVVGQEDFVTGENAKTSFLCSVQVQGENGRVTARLCDIDIRARQILVGSVDDADELLAKLDEERGQLPIALAHDFEANPIDEQVFYSWGEVAGWNEADKGLRIRAQGASTWESSGFSALQQYSGDFDVRWEFDDVDLLVPDRGRQSQVFLQIEFLDATATQVSSILTRNATGQYTGQGQHRTRTSTGYSYDTFATVPVSKTNMLRIARRGADLYFIAGSTETGQERLIGTRKVSSAPIRRTGLKFLVHPGHSDGMSQVLAKSIEVRTSVPVARAVVPAQPKPAAPNSPSLFDAIRGLFN